MPDQYRLRSVDGKLKAYRPSPVRRGLTRAVERNVSLGLQDPRDMAEVKAYGYVTRPCQRDTVPLADLLRHMAAHYSDSQLRNELDAVLPLCESDSDRAEVRKFARAKLAGKPYEIAGLESRQCQGCRKPFAASRRDARYCSPACRKSASRKTARTRHT